MGIKIVVVWLTYKLVLVSLDSWKSQLHPPPPEFVGIGCRFSRKWPKIRIPSWPPKSFQSRLFSLLDVESTKYYIFTSYVWKVKTMSKIADLLCCETQPPQWQFPTHRYWLQAQSKVSWLSFVLHCSPSPKVSHLIKDNQTTKPSFWKMGFSDPAPPAALRIALAVVLREMSEVLPPYWYSLRWEG